MNDKINIAISDKISTVNVADSEMDIGEKMKQRALKSYGVQDFLLNIDLLSSDKSESDVKYLWHWFDCMLALGLRFIKFLKGLN